MLKNNDDVIASGSRFIEMFPDLFVSYYRRLSFCTIVFGWTILLVVVVYMYVKKILQGYRQDTWQYLLSFIDIYIYIAIINLHYYQ